MIKSNLDLQTKMISQDFHSLKQYREDGRKRNQLRNFVCDVGFDSNYDGSSKVKMGLTEVICYVLGPQDVNLTIP